MRFDHVIYAAHDLTAGTEHVAAALGLTPAGGGEHEGQGTHNRLLPFAGGYVEVLALVDPAAAPASPLGAAVAAHGEGWLGWAVAVDDVEAVARRLDIAVTAIARAGFSARLAGVGEAMMEPALPFFVQRDAGVAAPYPDGPGPARLTLSGDREDLRAWLGEIPPYVDLAPGRLGVTAVSL